MTDDKTPIQPPALPDFIFLLSDHESRRLACEVADKLWTLDSRVLVWDFLTPIHDALAAMHNMDFGTDLGNDKVTDATRDEIVSLEKWYIDQYGETTLGQKAWAEAQEQRAMSDAPIVFRDATWTHLKAFLPHLKPHQYVVCDLVGGILPPNIAGPDMHLLHFANPTAEDVVHYIREAAK